MSLDRAPQLIRSEVVLLSLGEASNSVYGSDSLSQQSNSSELSLAGEEIAPESALGLQSDVPSSPRDPPPEQSEVPISSEYELHPSHLGSVESISMKSTQSEPENVDAGESSLGEDSYREEASSPRESTDDEKKEEANEETSLLVGEGNSTELAAAIVSGFKNKIKHGHGLGSSISEDEEDGGYEGKKCHIPTGCAIIGGDRNTINNTSRCRYCSVVVASSQVFLDDCENTVVLGLKGGPGQPPFSHYREATIARNLYALDRLHVGPELHLGPRNTVADINGNAYINGDLKVKGHLDTDSASFVTLAVEKANFQSLSAANIAHHSIFVEGSSETANVSIVRGDGINVVYANPSRGDIRIQLGREPNPSFEANRQLTVKDVSLEFGSGSSHNIYLWVPNRVRIEHYGNTGITVSDGGTYVLNSSGGAVTLRYASSFLPGALPTWVIENQLVGNPRILGSTGFKFAPADNGAREKLLRGPL